VAIVYYQIKSDIYSDFGVTRNPRLPPSASFIKGVRILDPLPRPIPFEVNYPDQPPHLVGNTIAVISEQLRQALQSMAIDNFEAFPATLRNPTTGAEWTDYWAFNVLGLVAAAHATSSTDTVIPANNEGVRTPLLGFRTLVLDKQKTQDLSMFRLAESPSTLLIHKRVLEALRANKPQGGWRFSSVAIDCV